MERLHHSPAALSRSIMGNHITDSGIDTHARLVSEAAVAITNQLRGSYAVRRGTYGQSDDESDRDRQGYLMAGLRDYSARTLHKIISMLNDPRASDHYALIDYINRCGLRDNESFVIDYLHLADCFTTVIRHKRLAQAVLAIDALSSYEGIAPHCPGDEYPEQRASHGAAIISVTEHLRGAITANDLPEETLTRKTFTSENETLADIVYDFSDGHTRIITDKSLRCLLTAPDYDPVSIAKIITERNLINPDDITAVLNSEKSNPSQAVNEGLL
jgi:hypothetical protein